MLDKLILILIILRHILSSFRPRLLLLPPPPAPLPLFGAAAAFGWRRQLRRRIKSPARIQAH
jgi:hypothetical protein